jgi:hypothetical protein
MEKLGGDGALWQLHCIIALSLFSGTLAFLVARSKPATSLIDIESLKLKTYSLWSTGQTLSHRGVSAALPPTAHVSNCLPLERFSIRSLPAGNLRGRPEYEGFRYKSSSAFWLPSHPYR